MSRLMEAPAPLHFGNYQVMQRPDGTPWLLGEGAYGRTYKAEHLFLRRACALKIIHERHMRDPHQRARFLQEARTAARLDHPGIAHIHDFGEADGVFFYAMEFCEGGTLDDYSGRRGPLPWPETAALASQVAAALACAHQAGLLHRDLKPQNVMLASPAGPPLLKLIDFGLVKVLASGSSDSTWASVSREGGFKGNYATASPEQTSEGEDLDERSDLFSLGVIAWWLLLGRSPFAEMSHPRLIADRLSAEPYAPRLPAHLDPAARAVLARLLEKRPADRFASATEVLAALAGTAAGGAPAGGAAEPAAPPPPAFEEAFEVLSSLEEMPAARLYLCRNRQGRRFTALLPAANALPAAIDGLARLARHGTPSDCCECLGEWRDDGGRPVFVFGELGPLSLLDVLKSLGGARLAEVAPALGLLARCADACLQQFGLPLEINPHLVRVATRGPASAIDSWARLDPAALRTVPRVPGDEPATAPAAESTVVTDDTEFPLSAQFASLVYRMVSGIAVKHAAYFAPEAYVPTAGLSEGGNRLLARIISGADPDRPASEVLRDLAALEGLPASAFATPPAAAPVAGAPPAPQAPAQTAAQATLPPPPLPPTTAPEPARPPAAAALPAAAAAAPPATPRPGARRSKAGLIAVAAVAACALLAAWPLARLLRRPGEPPPAGAVPATPPATPPAAAPTELSLAFPHLTTVGGTLPAGASFTLHDREGALIARIETAGDRLAATLVPAAVFRRTERWPLTLRMDSPDFLLEPVSFEAQDFRDAGGNAIHCSKPVRLAPRPLLRLEPLASAAGAAADLPADLARRYLRPADPQAAWELLDRDGGLAVVLPAGASFPCGAILALPGFEEIPFALTPGRQPTWDLKLKQRTVACCADGPFDQLAFHPGPATPDDPALGKLVADAAGQPVARAASFEDGFGKWELPALGGSVEVAAAGRSWSQPLPTATAWLVLSQAALSPPTDDEAGARFRTTRASAEAGDPHAQFTLGSMFFEGDGVAPSHAAGAAWFRLAAEQGHADAQFNLGVLYEQGGGSGVPPDPRRAVLWFSKAANAGHPKAQSSLALCYQEGRGIARDHDLAEQWFLKAAAKGYVVAMFNLAVLYDDQQGTRFDEHKAVEFYQQAAALGHPGAQFNLGLHHELGSGVERNLETAVELYQKAHAKGYPAAGEALRRLGIAPAGPADPATREQ